MVKLYSLKNFLLAVKGSSKYKDVSAISLAGFESLMKQQDKEYVFDEQEFVEALEKYLR